jgi:hypothetical protein
MEDYEDLPVDEILKMMDDLISKGFTCYVKWVCAGCGERVTSEVPNAFFTEGYCHTEKSDGTNCGFTTFADKYGLLVIARGGYNGTG